MSELWRLSASEVAHLVRTRKVSAREVADAALQRLDSVNPRIQAIVDCRPNLVREQADRVDSALAHGNDPGPLAGVPVTVKINIDQAGFATTDGSRLQETLVAKCNSPVVDNLVRTGAVLLGRSNAPTFALRWFTSNLLMAAPTHATHVPESGPAPDALPVLVVPPDPRAHAEPHDTRFFALRGFTRHSSRTIAHWQRERQDARSRMSDPSRDRAVEGVRRMSARARLNVPIGRSTSRKVPQRNAPSRRLIRFGNSLRKS